MTERTQRSLDDLSVYEPDDGITPFDAFLQATDEKQVVGDYLSNKIGQVYVRAGRIDLLDIGCGDGSLAGIAIDRANISEAAVSYCGLDPAPHHTQKAREEFVRRGISHRILDFTFEEFDTDTLYDVVLASNLYYLHMSQMPAFLRKARALTAASGVTLFAFRDNNDGILDLRHKFEAPLYAEFREPRTISDVISACEGSEFRLEVDRVESTLTIPTDEHRRAKIVEFILNTSIETLDTGYLASIYDYLDAKDNKLVSAQAIASVH